MNEHSISYGGINQLVLDTFKEDIFPIANEIFKKEYGSEMELLGTEIYIDERLNIGFKQINKCIEKACKQLEILL